VNLTRLSRASALLFPRQLDASQLSYRGVKPLLPALRKCGATHRLRSLAFRHLTLSPKEHGIIAEVLAAWPSLETLELSVSQAGQGNEVRAHMGCLGRSMLIIIGLLS
jgi:hypothetical protein